MIEHVEVILQVQHLIIKKVLFKTPYSDFFLLFLWKNDFLCNEVCWTMLKSVVHVYTVIPGYVDIRYTSSVLDFGFEPCSGQIKEYKIGTKCICCFSTKQVGSESEQCVQLSDMSTCRLLFQWASTIKSNSACWSSTKWTWTCSHWQLTCSRHDIHVAEKLLNWQ
jgi:hypothetical protein